MGLAHHMHLLTLIDGKANPTLFNACHRVWHRAARLWQLIVTDMHPCQLIDHRHIVTVTLQTINETKMHGRA